MPVLFTRLIGGCIWSIPVGPGELESWDALLDMIQQGRCVPILGPGLLEFLLGSQQEIAQRWADTYRFPMAADVRRDLPQVAQYLAVMQSDPEFPQRQLQKYLSLEMRKRYPEELSTLADDATLDELIQRVGRERRKTDPDEPFSVLAALPLPIYVTTTPDSLISGALRAAERAPVAELFHWVGDDEVDWPRSAFARESDYEPGSERPLVYHLFGKLELEDSVVLTEDDYFKYLVAITKREDPIPDCVLRAWSEGTLLFLGFRVDDWHFRVLFQSIMKQEGSRRRKKKPHVAVQLDLEDGGTMDPERARVYLERYFRDEQINIYWGSSDKFVRELWSRWQARQNSAGMVRQPS